MKTGDASYFLSDLDECSSRNNMKEALKISKCNYVQDVVLRMFLTYSEIGEI